MQSGKIWLRTQAIGVVPPLPVVGSVTSCQIMGVLRTTASLDSGGVGGAAMEGLGTG